MERVGALKYLVVNIYSKTCFQRLSLNQLKSSSGVGIPFGAKENSVFAALPVKPVCEIKHMGNEKDLKAFFKQCAHDLKRDLGAFSFIGGSKRFIKKK